MFLSRVNEISGGCEKSQFWSSYQLIPFDRESGERGGGGEGGRGRRRMLPTSDSCGLIGRYFN